MIFYLWRVEIFCFDPDFILPALWPPSQTISFMLQEMRCLFKRVSQRNSLTRGAQQGNLLDLTATELLTKQSKGRVVNLRPERSRGSSPKVSAQLRKGRGHRLLVRDTHRIIQIF